MNTAVLNYLSGGCCSNCHYACGNYCRKQHAFIDPVYICNDWEQKIYYIEEDYEEFQRRCCE